MSAATKNAAPSADVSDAMPTGAVDPGAPEAEGGAPAPVERDVARSRSGALADQASEVKDPREKYELAPALDGHPGEWHKSADGGHIAITRAKIADNKVRDFITYVPPRGRVSSIPLYALDAHPEIGV